MNKDVQYFFHSNILFSRSTLSYLVFQINYRFAAHFKKYMQLLSCWLVNIQNFIFVFVLGHTKWCSGVTSCSPLSNHSWQYPEHPRDTGHQTLISHRDGKHPICPQTSKILKIKDVIIYLIPWKNYSFTQMRVARDDDSSKSIRIKHPLKKDNSYFKSFSVIWNITCSENIL